MNPQDRDFPWVFLRDEIDILEDELEDLYQTHHCPSEASSFESLVLSEQIDTQDYSDRELTNRLGINVLESSQEEMIPFQESEVSTDSMNEWREELSSIRAHPLYQEAKKWAANVKATAKRKYEEGGVYASGMFRIYANVNLVPLKIFAALCEETHEDEVGYECARAEYRLAFVYLTRIIESMKLMFFAPECSSFIEENYALAEMLQKKLVMTMNHFPNK